MKYHIITQHGPSEHTSQSDATTMLYVVGQGATDASAGWLLITTILSNLYDKVAHGCKLQPPDKTTTLNWSHVMFVDYATLIHVRNACNISRAELQLMVHHDVNEWNNGLHISVGFLNGQKTNYYMVQWKFQPNGTPYINTQFEPANPVNITNQ